MYYIRIRMLRQRDGVKVQLHSWLIVCSQIVVRLTFKAINLRLSKSEKHENLADEM